MDRSSKRSSTSRRSFITQATLAATGIGLGVRSAGANTTTYTARQLTRLTPNALCVDQIAPDVLRTLATAAMNAAKEAGAEFADIRIGEQRTFGISTQK